MLGLLALVLLVKLLDRGVDVPDVEVYAGVGAGLLKLGQGRRRAVATVMRMVVNLLTSNADAGSDHGAVSDPVGDLLHAVQTCTSVGVVMSVSAHPRRAASRASRGR